MAVDPDHHVFRHLTPEETPPILRDVTLGSTPVALLPDVPAAREAAQRLADRLFGSPVSAVTAVGAKAGEGPLLVVSVGEGGGVLDALGVDPPDLEQDGAARAWAWRLPDGRPLLVVEAEDTEALTALIRPLPHYGQDSWLVFDGNQVLDRGLWDPPAQPLRREF